jgi:hypothetical protein
VDTHERNREREQVFDRRHERCPARLHASARRHLRAAVRDGKQIEIKSKSNQIKIKSNQIKYAANPQECGSAQQLRWRQQQ